MEDSDPASATTQPSRSEQRRISRVASLLAWLMPCLAYILVLTFTLGSAERLTDGHLVYALDDAYIHMSVAKTLVLSHTYGLQSHQFSSPESTILWPFLVALGFLVTGSSLRVPLILNILFSIAAIFSMSYLLARLKIGPAWRLIAGLLLVFMTPLVPLSMTGMEHIGQCVAVLLFAGCFVLTLSRDRNSLVENAAVCCSASLMVLFRFEGLFVAFAAAVLLVWKKRWTEGALAMLGAGLPAIAFALWLRSHGHFFLPDSMAVKHPQSIVGTLTLNLIINPVGRSLALSSICLVAMLPLVTRKTCATTALGLLTLFAVGIHAILSPFGWFYRYEAYLVALLILALVLALHDLSADLRLNPAAGSIRLLTFLVLFSACSWGLIERGIIAQNKVSLATQDIYLQQVQMSRFFARYYSGEPIALNDIGAVSYFGQSPILDIHGLASHDVARLKLEKRYDYPAMLALAAQNGVSVAAVYDDNVPQWTKAGVWYIPREQVVLGSTKVYFYATSPCKAAALASQLQDFQTSVPTGTMLFTNPNLPGNCSPAAH